MENKVLEGVRAGVRRLRSLDVRILLVITLIVVSTGHVGRLFAEREAERQAFVGYILALSLDGVLAVSLYEAANVRKRSHRVYAVCVFVFACAVSAGFNVAYYRINYPGDPPLVSALLGATAPILAALVSVLKSFGDGERTESEQAEREAERALELEKYRIEQAERTRREQLTERERTKQVRAQARAEKTRADAMVQASERQAEQGPNGGSERLKAGELDELALVILAEDPDIGPRPLARRLGCPPSTAAGVLKRIRQGGGDA